MKILKLSIELSLKKKKFISWYEKCLQLLNLTSNRILKEIRFEVVGIFHVSTIKHSFIMFLGFKSIIISLYQGFRMFVHSRAKENILHDHKLKDKFSQSKIINKN